MDPLNAKEYDTLLGSKNSLESIGLIFLKNPMLDTWDPLNRLNANQTIIQGIHEFCAVIILQQSTY